MEDSHLWVMMALFSNVPDKPAEISRMEVINIILTGDWHIESEMDPRYLKAKISNSLELYFDITRTTHKLGMELLQTLAPDDITSNIEYR